MSSVNKSEEIGANRRRIPENKDQRAAKGGTQKGEGHFFCFGHLLVTILSLF